MRARNLLPWRDFVIETSWPPNVAATEIKKRIGKPRLFGRSDETFVGKSTSEGEFRFSRAIRYKNSFLPIIHAAVEPSYRDGARVRVRMRLHGLVLAFMAIWMTAAASGALVGLVSLARGRPVGLVGVVFTVSVASFVAVTFSREADVAEALLRRIFAAAPALPSAPDTGAPYR